MQSSSMLEKKDVMLCVICLGWAISVQTSQTGWCVVRSVRWLFTLSVHLKQATGYVSGDLKHISNLVASLFLNDPCCIQKLFLQSLASYAYAIEDGFTFLLYFYKDGASLDHVCMEINTTYLLADIFGICKHATILCIPLHDVRFSLI